MLEMGAGEQSHVHHPLCMNKSYTGFITSAINLIKYEYFLRN